MPCEYCGTIVKWVINPDNPNAPPKPESRYWRADDKHNIVDVYCSPECGLIMYAQGKEQ